MAVGAKGACSEGGGIAEVGRAAGWVRRGDAGQGSLGGGGGVQAETDG